MRIEFDLTPTVLSTVNWDGPYYAQDGEPDTYLIAAALKDAKPKNKRKAWHFDVTIRAAKVIAYHLRSYGEMATSVDASMKSAYRSCLMAAMKIEKQLEEIVPADCKHNNVSPEGICDGCKTQVWALPGDPQYWPPKVGDAITVVGKTWKGYIGTVTSVSEDGKTCCVDVNVRKRLPGRIENFRIPFYKVDRVWLDDGVIIWLETGHRGFPENDRGGVK